MTTGVGAGVAVGTGVSGVVGRGVGSGVAVGASVGLSEADTVSVTPPVSRAAPPLTNHMISATAASATATASSFMPSPVFCFFLRFLPLADLEPVFAPAFLTVFLTAWPVGFAAAFFAVFLTGAPSDAAPAFLTGFLTGVPSDAAAAFLTVFLTVVPSDVAAAFLAGFFSGASPAGAVVFFVSLILPPVSVPLTGDRDPSHFSFYDAARGGVKFISRYRENCPSGFFD